MDKPSRNTLSDIDAALADLLDTETQPDTVPDGWLTTQQWADKLGKSRCHIGRRISELVTSGRWESREFRVPTRGRGIYPTPHYRPCPG